MATLKHQGQALVELSLMVALLGLFLIWAIPTLHTALLIRAESQEQAALILAQASWREQQGLEPLGFTRLYEEYAYPKRQAPQLELTVSDHYGVAKYLASTWEWMLGAGQFEMKMKNLYQLRLTQAGEEREWLRLVKLADDWSPKQVQQLSSRPQALTTSSLLESLGVPYLQNTLAILPFAQELHSSQLKLGYINVDVVPESALCWSEACRE